MSARLSPSCSTAGRPQLVGVGPVDQLRRGPAASHGARHGQLFSVASSRRVTRSVTTSTATSAVGIGGRRGQGRHIGGVDHSCRHDRVGQ